MRWRAVCARPYITGGADGRVGLWRVAPPPHRAAGDRHPAGVVSNSNKLGLTLLGMRDLPLAPRALNISAAVVTNVNGNTAVSRSRAVWALACCREVNQTGAAMDGEAAAGELLVTVGLDDSSVLVVRGLERVDDNHNATTTTTDDAGGGNEVAAAVSSAAAEVVAAAVAPVPLVFDEVTNGHVADVNAAAWSPTVGIISPIDPVSVHPDTLPASGTPQRRQALLATAAEERRVMLWSALDRRLVVGTGVSQLKLHLILL